ncbi:hypothetical protein Ahy_B09g097938 [Arachis hypogaea]|uniref:UBC core domain-containing protein n=1 Tax=Arachis hypogaea TaxID=3818 RepID=A0A444XQS5_ARAHY|nr:hypothetical protein Ahy_B09g097938 [Arachis hypogaea]
MFWRTLNERNPSRVALRLALHRRCLTQVLSAVAVPAPQHRRFFLFPVNSADPLRLFIFTGFSAQTQELHTKVAYSSLTSSFLPIILSTLLSIQTRIYHCNVGTDGHVSLGMLKDGWSPTLTITKVLTAIRSLLTNPDPYNAVVPGIAHLYLENKAKHVVAGEWTARFAK